MKILITLDFPPEHGGIQRYLGDIVNHTYTTDDRVIVGARTKTLSASQRFRYPCTYVTTPVSFLNKKFSLLPLLFSLWKIRRRAQPPLAIECGNVYAGLAARFLKLFMPLTYAVYTYGTELLSLRNKNPLARILRSTLESAEVLYILGSYTETLLRRAGIRTRTFLVPPRIERAALRERNPDERNLPLTKLRILSVGRLVPHKGHDTLIRAAARLSFPWELTIVGEGPCKKNLLELAHRLGKSEHIAVVSSQDDNQLEHAYSWADVFVLPSLESPSGTEGFGIVLLEAMARSVPIVASRAGGIPDVVDDCAILFLPGDYEDLSAALERLYLNTALRESLSRNGLSRVRQHYVWN